MRLKISLLREQIVYLEIRRKYIWIKSYKYVKLVVIRENQRRNTTTKAQFKKRYTILILYYTVL